MRGDAPFDIGKFQSTHLLLARVLQVCSLQCWWLQRLCFVNYCAGVTTTSAHNIHSLHIFIMWTHRHDYQRFICERVSGYDTLLLLLQLWLLGRDGFSVECKKRILVCLYWMQKCLYVRMESYDDNPRKSARYADKCTVIYHVKGFFPLPSLRAVW